MVELFFFSLILIFDQIKKERKLLKTLGNLAKVHELMGPTQKRRKAANIPQFNCPWHNFYLLPLPSPSPPYPLPLP